MTTSPLAYEVDDGQYARVYCPRCAPLALERLGNRLVYVLALRTREECIAEIDGLPCRCHTCDREVVQ